MDAIRILRQRAADRRDKAVKAARDEFRKASRLIDELAESIGPEPPKAPRRKNQPRPIIDLILQVMPTDRTFSLEDLVGLLNAAEPARDFHVPSVRTLMPRLVERGLMRKVCRSAAGRVLWAAPECEVADAPIAALSIADAAEIVLREAGPLTSPELIVALKERGYREDADPRTLLVTWRYAVKRCRGRFAKGEDGRWSTTLT